jgi:hypothetical protein
VPVVFKQSANQPAVERDRATNRPQLGRSGHAGLVADKDDLGKASRPIEDRGLQLIGDVDAGSEAGRPSPLAHGVGGEVEVPADVHEQTGEGRFGADQDGPFGWKPWVFLRGADMEDDVVGVQRNVSLVLGEHVGLNGDSSCRRDVESGESEWGRGRG